MINLVSGKIEESMTYLKAFENLVGKTSGWNLPIWIASLDLHKAFDRILHQPLFQALHLQKVPEGYVHLLMVLYKNQKGSIDGKQFFDIQRGVKQGDTLSAMFFNVIIEEAFIQWKTKLTSEEWFLKENVCRLTNIRYADDMLLFAKSRGELENMMGFVSRRVTKNWFRCQCK